MKEKRKIRLTSLSVKVILLLFAILFLVISTLRIILAIISAAGGSMPDEAGKVETWLFILPLIVGVGIIALFALAINKVVVARIRKINKATKEVADGNFDAVVETGGRDELSELADSFNKMSEALKTNEYLSKDFVRNVSHEFKTPLSVVKGYGEMIEGEILRGNPDKEALLEYARAIMSESDRLTLLTKSILQLSLLNSTAIIKKDDSFMPAGQVRDILRLMQAKWSEKNIILDLQLEDIIITGNEQLLYQVWQNLISNAIKFSNEGGTVKIILTRHGDEGLYFEVADNGAGISDEDKPRIFTQFFMADKSRNTEGSGLGLSIVKRIVDLIGGKISFESQEGAGTRFSLYL